MDLPICVGSLVTLLNVCSSCAMDMKQQGSPTNNNKKRFLVRANIKSSSYSSCWQHAARHKAEPYVLLLSADLLKCC